MRNEEHCRRIRNPWVIVPVARTGLDLNVTAAMDQSFLSSKDKNPRVVKPVPRSAIQLADSQFLFRTLNRSMSTISGPKNNDKQPPQQACNILTASSKRHVRLHRRTRSPGRRESAGSH